MSPGVTTALGGEDAAVQPEWDLCTYSIRAADVQPVAALVVSIAGRANVVLLPISRELIVFGPLLVQDEVAARIVAYESTVTLTQSIDTESFDARELAIALNAALAAGMFGYEPDSAPRIVADDSAGRVYVWAKEAQLARILDMAAKWKDIRNTASRPAREPSAGQSADSTKLGRRQPRSARAGMDDRGTVASSGRSELAETREAPGNRSQLRPAPRGPVQIEHLEGTDLLLLRERGGHQPGKASRPAPIGPVQIEHLEGTDLLLLRGR